MAFNGFIRSVYTPIIIIMLLYLLFRDMVQTIMRVIDNGQLDLKQKLHLKQVFHPSFTLLHSSSLSSFPFSSLVLYHQVRIIVRDIYKEAEDYPAVNLYRPGWQERMTFITIKVLFLASYYFLLSILLYCHLYTHTHTHTHIYIHFI